MTLFLKFVVAAAAGLLLTAGAAVAEPLKFGVAAEPYPPFSAPDASGKWVGWEIDFMEALCKEAKLECVLQPTAWDGIIAALTAKKIDVIWASMSITAEREKTISFTDPYYKTPLAIIGAKGKKIDGTPESMKGLTLGFQVSTTQADYAQKYYANVATLKTYQTQDEVNQDLTAGRIDAQIADKLPLLDFLKTPEAVNCCEFKGDAPWDEAIIGRGTGAGLRKEDTELQGKLNAAIAALRANGEYEKITKKYFTFDIWGR
jgi:polar amino acid transport system substrate-binding protein